MKIVLPEDFFKILNNCHLLLDTSVFIDSSINPVEFGNFFNQLRANDITLVTIDPVIVEFLKGSPSPEKFDAKQSAVSEITGTNLPLTSDIFDSVKLLVILYKEEGKSLSLTDLLLGASLMQYEKGLYLLTKNVTDFPTNIFNLATHLNLLHRKAIQSYGVYNFTK